jgi:hypothetical protein
LEFNVEDRSFGLFVQTSLDAETLKPGLNFTLTTDIGALDLLEKFRELDSTKRYLRIH